MTHRTDTERLTDKRDELLARIEALELQRANLVRKHVQAGQNGSVMGQDGLGEYIDAIGDKLGPLRDRLEEIEEELGWDDWREERRNSPIVL